MRHAPRTDAAAALGRDAPGPPREHTRTERTAITTFPHQLRAPPSKARAHASTFLLPKPRRRGTAGTHQIPHKPECTPRNHLGTPIRPSHCRSSAPIAAHPPPIPTICTQPKACLASNTTRACCHPLPTREELAIRQRIRARLAHTPSPTPSAAPRTCNACMAATLATGALAACMLLLPPPCDPYASGDGLRGPVKNAMGPSPFYRNHAFGPP